MSKLEQELDGLLQSLQALKPPGASKGKIAAITTLCTDNIQSDSLIAQRIYTHFKRTPPTHKLGILFVIDSVTRQWVEKARELGQPLSGSSAPGGTYPSGLFMMGELMPALLDDMIKVAPQDQKAKVQNLLDVWERGTAFNPKMLATYKQKLKGHSNVPSSTPPGSPSVALLSSLGLPTPKRSQAQPAPSQSAQPQSAAPGGNDAASILAALSSMNNPQQGILPPPQSGPPAQDMSALFAAVGQQPPSQQNAYQQGFQPPQPPPSQYPQQPPVPPQFQGIFPPSIPAPPAVPQFAPAPPASSASNPIAALASILPPQILTNPEQLTQVLKLFQELSQAGIPQEQWGPVLAALYPQNQAAPAQAPSWQAPPQNDYGSSRYGDQNGRRDRSRSPDYQRDRGSAANRRPSPVYGTYDASAAKEVDAYQDDSDRRGRRQGGGANGKFRRRSPLAAARPTSMDPTSMPKNISPKWTDMDPNIPPGHVKVLSRTLFVGGANGTEADLRAIFGRYGRVQTCIVNSDKRHAFVKMCTRQDAVAARAGMENNRDNEVSSKARQTKWGVGFGPRECCDYSTGVSTIPIDSLTDADHKWVLTAEYGGTGGRPIESGLVFEEPDIEIGAGVSSKAMSRRVMPEVGNKRNRGGDGDKDNGRRGGGGGGAGRFRQPEPRYESPRPEPANVQPPPPVPNFGFNLAFPPYQ